MMAQCPDGHQSVATDYCDECGLSIGTPAHAAGGSSPSGGGAPNYGSAGEPCPNCLLPRQAGDTFCEGCGFNFADEQTGKTVDQPQLDIEAELRKAEKAQREAEQREAEQREAERLRSGSGQNGSAQTGSGQTGSGQSNSGQTGSGRSGSSQTGGPVNPGPQTDPDSDPLARTVTSDPTGIGGAASGSTAQWIAIASADRAYYDAVVAEGEIDPNAYPFPPYCPERQFELKGDTVRIGRTGKRGTVDIDLTGPPTDPGVSHLHAVLQHRPDGGWQVVDLESMNGTVLNDDTAPIPANQAFPVEAGYRIHVGVWTTLTLIQLD
ncbi:hypothetical protein ABH926_005595 [Catenulispora sp. GP43]|uniref:FHA domain-containing protein n=1 Tax=Catenulispora sp. GP43 TaxID=3156263 RepID=UPI0035133BFE